MPNAAQLKSRGNELSVKIGSIIDDAKMTGAEKSVALDALQADVEAHRVEVKNSERASEWRAKLAAGGEAFEDTGKTTEVSSKGMQAAQYGSGRLSGQQVAHQFMAHEALGIAIKQLGGKDGLGARGRMNELFEIGVKASDAASNLMGEGLYGGTGPTALGQNPFFTGAAGAGILPTWLPGIVEQRFYKLTIPDLFTNIGVDTPGISYLVESAANFNADVVAEGGTYPFSSETLSRVYEQVGKVANAIKITDETVRDAPQFFQFAQGRLTLGVQRKEEVALLAGPGGNGVNGLLNRAASFTKPQTISAMTNVSFAPSGTPGSGAVPTVISSLVPGRAVIGTGTTGTAPTGGQIANGVYAAITDIEVSAFVDVDAVVMNPYDWQTVRLATDQQGQYFGGSFFGGQYGVQNTQFNGPFPQGETLWGRRVVTTPLIPQGLVLVGSFGPEVANVFRRQGITVEMTNSDGTDFDKGIVTVRAESRLALAVYRPAGFELIQLKTAP